MLGARGVDDQQEPVAVAGDHEVVEDAAALVGEQPVALAPVGQADQIRRDQGLEGGRRVRRVARVGRDEHLAHVRDVEQAGVGARVEVFGHDARELDRQLPAGELDEPGAGLGVQSVQRGGLR